MTKDPQQIAEQIVSLVSELASLAGAQTVNRAMPTPPSKPHLKTKTGPVAGVRSLIQDGKLDMPKSAAEIVELLRQNARHYPNKTVLVSLLRLVRERALVRLKEKGDTTWKYVIRR